MGLAVGLDIGSTTTKVALIERDGVLGCAVTATGANCRKAAETVLAQALADADRDADSIAYMLATGYGRRLVEHADATISEITANASGARYLTRDTTPARTIIDIGGQDSKVISLDDDGIVQNFAMNDKCAAGTGRFLEVMSRILEMDLDQLGPLSLESTENVAISSICTVFAETEVISLLAQARKQADIIAGVHRSIAKRVCDMARGVGVSEPVFFDGGPALNVGLRRALEAELSVELIVPDSPQVATAVGAAAIAAGRLSRSA
ncbi:MAG TPA: acyl-CoA dehydratase activase [Armatimonadota bacterium]|jgi:predicted CoA-substrate-specific enzyme activase|nr:acyl-CoA dehydratase activase [Armatimonadota bacterium]